MTQAAQASVFNSLGSEGSVYSQKYQGLIKRSLKSVWVQRMFAFFWQVWSEAPRLGAMHSVISVFRIIQLFAPCVASSIGNLYEDGSIDKTAISYLSILAYIVPPAYRHASQLYILVISIVLSVVMVTIGVAATRVFVKKSTIASGVSMTIAIVFGTFGELLPTITFTYVWETISRMAFGEEDAYALYIVLIIATCVTMFAWMYMMLQISGETLLLRRTALHTVLNCTQIRVTVLGVCMNCVVAFGVAAPKLCQAILMFINAAVYAVTCWQVQLNGGLVKQIERYLVTGVCVSGCIFSIVGGVFLFVGIHFSLITLFLSILVVVISVIAQMLIERKLTISRLCFLDDYEANHDVFFELKRQHQYMDTALVGLKYAHPTLLDMSFLASGTEKWPNAPKVWLFYAKFVAVYPNEAPRLKMIVASASTHKMKGREMKCLKFQSIMLSKRREQGLSVALKSKFGKLNKSVSSSKHKMRRVWEVVLQANIAELDLAVRKAWDSVADTESMFKQILMQYPNNRFVYRAYARFLSELKADYASAQLVVNSLHVLQSGVDVIPDEAYSLGINAFPTMPLSIGTITRERISDASDIVECSESADFGGTTEDLSSEALKRAIENVRIPAIRCAIITRIVFLLILMIAPSIFIAVYMNSYAGENLSLLTYMYEIVCIRTLTYQLTAFAHRHYFEKIGQMAPLRPSGDPPRSLGSTWDTAQQVEYLLGEYQLRLQDLSMFKSVTISDPNIVQAKEYIFGSHTSYAMFKSLEEYETTTFSIQSACLDLIVSLNGFSNFTFDESYINSSNLLNPSYNADAITTVLNEAMTSINEYLTRYYTDANTLMTIVFGTVPTVVAICYIISLIVQTIRIKQTERECYRSLVSLPKNVVSTVAENLRILAKEDGTMGQESSVEGNSTINKQEENILKLFNVGVGSSNTRQVMQFVLLWVSEIILIIFSYVMFLELMVETKSCNRTILYNGPHLDYLTGAYSSLVTMLYSVHNTLMSYYPIHITLWDRTGTINYFYLRGNQSREYYHMARFGGQENTQIPFVGYDEALENAKVAIQCNESDLRSGELIRILKCFDCDLVFNMMQPLADQYISAYVKAGVDLNSLDEIYADIWLLQIHPLYEEFFAPMFETIVTTVAAELRKSQTAVLPRAIAVIVIAIIIEILAIRLLYSIRQHIISILELLMFCPPGVAMQSSKVAEVLSSIFRESKGENVIKTNEFCEQVVNDLPDGVLVISATFIAESANKSMLKFLGDQDIVGKDVSEIFPKPLLKPSGHADFQMTLANGDRVNLEGNCTQHNHKMIITCRDVTQTVRYRTLISDEKMRSDTLLQSILPATLVKRVQNGEKTISFEVKMASILFMDIVSFTPWCGSLPAATVMSTLNKLFKSFDSLVQTYPTMTKIKCIGDCYMAAAGVFDDICQPAVTSKESVSFGLDCIEAVTHINQEIGEKLRIRVGINTGGPIVAGVLGVGKPTFEILGPAINMAQQMEHHGVPMQVHISRTVYEYVYGDVFVMKEREPMQIKDQMVVTYLVTGRNAPATSRQ